MSLVGKKLAGLLAPYRGMPPGVTLAAPSERQAPACLPWNMAPDERLVAAIDADVGSLRDLAEACELTKKTVECALPRLERAGHIIIEGKGTGRRSRYRVSPDRPLGVPQASPEASPKRPLRGGQGGRGVSSSVVVRPQAVERTNDADERVSPSVEESPERPPTVPRASPSEGDGFLAALERARGRAFALGFVEGLVESGVDLRALAAIHRDLKPSNPTETPSWSTSAPIPPKPPASPPASAATPGGTMSEPSRPDPAPQAATAGASPSGRRPTERDPSVGHPSTPAAPPAPVHRSEPGTWGRSAPALAAGTLPTSTGSGSASTSTPRTSTLASAPSLGVAALASGGTQGGPTTGATDLGPPSVAPRSAPVAATSGPSPNPSPSTAPVNHRAFLLDLTDACLSTGEPGGPSSVELLEEHGAVVLEHGLAYVLVTKPKKSACATLHWALANPAQIASSPRTIAAALARSKRPSHPWAEPLVAHLIPRAPSTGPRPAPKRPVPSPGESAERDAWASRIARARAHVARLDVETQEDLEARAKDAALDELGPKHTRPQFLDATGRHLARLVEAEQAKKRVTA